MISSDDYMEIGRICSAGTSDVANLTGAGDDAPDHPSLIRDSRDTCQIITLIETRIHIGVIVRGN